MDFEKIKPAVEEIVLSEIQQKRIIEACEKQKKKSFNYKLWIPVAAAAVFTIVIFSPGFIFRASKSADNMALPESGNGFVNFADSINDAVYDKEILYDAAEEECVSVQNQSLTVDSEILFDSGIYREIYSVIPSQFIRLVDSEEYEKWKKSVSFSGGMAMLQFVEHFGISREEFDIANEDYKAYISEMKMSAENPQKAEVFNADIIYTFNREEIDHYYLESYN